MATTWENVSFMIASIGTMRTMMTMIMEKVNYIYI